MNILSKIRNKLFCDKAVKQSRDICKKLHDSLVKYASEKIDEMNIWEFMSLDGAVITGYEYNDCKERTVTVYYDRHLT